MKLKAEFVSPIRVTTEARGLVALTQPKRFSGTSSLTQAEQREQAATMSVALAQPHRANVYDTAGNLIASADNRRLGTALGRFCACHKPRPLADWLYDAGREYDRIVYEFRKSIDAATVKQSSDPLGVPMMGANGQIMDEGARAELTERRWSEARDVLDGVDRQAAIKLEYVCHDERDPPAEWSDVLVKGLVALAKHWKLDPKNFRDGDDFFA